MALNAYLTLRGVTQGPIQGSVSQQGRSGSIAVIAYSHEISSPADAATGQPTGKRVHHPLSITKEIDRSSPALYNALADNESIVEWTLRFWEPSATGGDVQHYTISLRNARVVGIESMMLDNKNPANVQLKEREIVTFAYEEITWTWTDSGVTGSDTWL